MFDQDAAIFNSFPAIEQAQEFWVNVMKTTIPLSSLEAETILTNLSSFEPPHCLLCQMINNVRLLFLDST